ncbi:MAG: hypothetical protein KGJ82_15260 [Nitrospirota bacterium]|nr:hypothetical protein [Nitrospirota bacterium]
MPLRSELFFTGSVTSEQRRCFYARHRFLAILMILVVPLFPFAGLYQDAEKIRQRRSRIAQILNGDRPPHHSAARTDLVLLIRRTVRPQRVRLRSSLTAALLDGLFEHPEVSLASTPCGIC